MCSFAPKNSFTPKSVILKNRGKEMGFTRAEVNFVL
jgi:hypothetical protein